MNNHEILRYWNSITHDIIGASYKVHSKLGPGLLESAYEVCLEYELKKSGYEVLRQLELPIFYEHKRLDVNYRIDLLVNGSIVVEVKAVNELHDIHMAQIITYLKLAECKVGLLINFNTPDLKKGIKRVQI